MDRKLDEENEDEFDVIGKNIAYKLRKLSKETAVVTEKLLMDVLFEAHVGNINRQSKVTISQGTAEPSVVHPTMPSYTNLQPWHTSSAPPPVLTYAPSQPMHASSELELNHDDSVTTRTFFSQFQPTS